MRLREALTPQDAAQVQKRFGSWALKTKIRFKSKDQKEGGSRAWIQGFYIYLPTSWATITLDPHDLKRVEGKLDLSDPRDRETLYHELYHLVQYRRGITWRIRIAYWRLAESNQRERPHEKEAIEIARKWAKEDS